MTTTRNNRQYCSETDHRVFLPHQAGIYEIQLKHYYDYTMRVIYNEKFKEAPWWQHWGSRYT